MMILGILSTVIAALLVMEYKEAKKTRIKDKQSLENIRKQSEIAKRLGFTLDTKSNLSSSTGKRW